jgi:muramoyltetrapeptide carboxypeptidase LdcA involved in peptidoglycan recycling
VISDSRSASLARPPALRPGDRVAVICVSSPVEPGALAAGLDALRFAGLDPVTYPSAHDPGTMRPYLAGDDAMRAGDLRAALTDPGIAGIVFARGGSLLRTLMRPEQATVIRYPEAVPLVPRGGPRDHHGRHAVPARVLA